MPGAGAEFVRRHAFNAVFIITVALLSLLCVPMRACVREPTYVRAR